MKLVWNSVAPWIGTGYGQQTALFTPRIRDLGHDVALSVYAGLEGTIGTWEGMTVYPADLTRYNKYALRKYVQRHADGDPLESVLVLTLQDVWPWLDPRYGGIADYRGLRMASWCPIDHDPCPPNVASALRTFDSRPIAMSRFGEDRLRKAGFDPLYVPHGIDTQAFRPWAERDEIRQSMKIPTDRFVVGMVANNQGQEVPRKSFPQVFAAFAMFLEKRPDSFLYLHTDSFGLNVGLNLVALAETFGIPEDSIGFVNQDKYWLGEIGHVQMGRCYSAMDVLLCPSFGEGFGIPLIEAQACGTPVITTDWTSMTEMCGVGWLVDGDPWYDAGCGSWWKCPAIGEIKNALEMAYGERGNMELRENARRFALAYDVETVTQEFWKPTLEALDRPREIAPLGNRAQRRAEKKAVTA